jgi:hypothetical protein
VDEKLTADRGFPFEVGIPLEGLKETVWPIRHATRHTATSVQCFDAIVVKQ